VGQGRRLTLVHFSAQPVPPFLVTEILNHPAYPTKCALGQPEMWTSVGSAVGQLLRALTGHVLGAVL
jgi:hypothetical protein